MTEVLLLALKVSVGLLILAIGAGSTFGDLLYIWRRPALRLRKLGAFGSDAYVVSRVVLSSPRRR